MRGLACLVAVATLLPTMTLADGCYVVVHARGERSTTLSSDGQRALLVWQDGKETLHLQSNYEGPAADFAWVIPVPARPAVSRSSWELFTQVEEATRPRVHFAVVSYHGGLCGCSGGEASTEEQGTADAAVAVLETLSIAEFHVDIVHARDGGGFVDWLRGKSYRVDEKAAPVLQQYVDKEFYFVAVRIREGAMAPAGDGKAMVSGGLTPLSVSFETDKPFYPLAISAISSAAENELLLLAATPWRTVPEGWDWTRLSDGDVQAAVGAGTARSPRGGQACGCRASAGQGTPEAPVDLAPAVRAAQSVLRKPALVVVSAIEGRWTLLPDGALAPATPDSPGAPTVLTRFRAFLKPKHMQDITFRPMVPEDIEPFGRQEQREPFGREPQDFYIEVSSAASPSPVRVALCLAGFVLATLGVGRRRPGLRSAGILLVFMAMAISL